MAAPKAPTFSSPASEVTAADHLLLLINILGLVLAGIDAWLDLGAWSAYACVALTSGLYLTHGVWRGSQLLKLLLVFGIAAGVAELAADWWLVSVTQTLIYADWGPFLIDSPAYMPLSWAGIVLSMGYLGWVVQRKYGMWAGILTATVVTGVYVPGFEALAHYAGWWTYANCSMWGVVPWYIIVGESLIGMALAPLVTWVLVSRKFSTALLAGTATGLWIWVAYFIALRVT